MRPTLETSIDTYLTISPTLRNTPLTLETIQAYRDHLVGENEGQNSIRRHIIGIRQYIRCLEDEGIIEKKDCFSEHIALPERLNKPQRYLSDDEVHSLLSAARAQDSKVKATRDVAIISLLAYEGVKASELIQLEWKDALLVKDRSSLNVKGTRHRTVQLQEPTEKALLDYREHHRKLELSEPSKMFVAFKGADSRVAIPVLTRHGLKFMLAEHATKLAWPKLNSELLRHYAIKYMFEQGFSPEDIMAHIGLKKTRQHRKVFE